jgi:exonuclease 1
MERVRMLRHHNIEPYVVFDGGPLPAKKGTEKERKLKRDENLAKANLLASQGKHTQAREFYMKCVDVTPQMAYQLIKVGRVFNSPSQSCQAETAIGSASRVGTICGGTI